MVLHFRHADLDICSAAATQHWHHRWYNCYPSLVFNKLSCQDTSQSNFG